MTLEGARGPSSSTPSISADGSATAARGAVHEVTDKRINESGDAWSVVYK
jgi:hypothetical protein